MATTMPYDSARKQIIRARAKKQEEDAGGKDGLRGAKLTVKGVTSIEPIYRFQLDDLAFNKANGRIKAEVIESRPSAITQISKVDKSAGYDILSFRGTGKDPSANVFIEVKGTKNSNLRFIWSYNERSVAEIEKDRYWIYGYTNVDLVAKFADGPIVIKNPCTNLVKLGYTSIPLDVYVTKD